jgi:hypothetical protein
MSKNRRVPGYELFVHEAFFVVDHAFAGVFGDLELAGVHTDGVLWADFDTEAAIDTFAKIKDELSGVFFNIRVRVFCGSDLNTACRAYGLTHHAGHTTGRAVLALG